MNIPQSLLYTKDHEWVRVDGDLAVIGVTDFAQGELGDVVFVQLPEIGQTIIQEKSFGTIEAVKAVADIYAPLSGVITAVNPALNDRPELMNKDPYGEGWIVKIKPGNLQEERTQLLDAAAYTELTGA